MADVIYEHRMSDADALMWNIEKDPGLRSTITSVALFDGTFVPERLERRLERLTRVVPRLRQRVVSNPFSIAPPRWENDPNFTLGYHVRWARAPKSGSLSEVFDLCAALGLQGFDRARPLWELLVIEGVNWHEDPEHPPGTVLMTKIHHAITDGVGGMELQLELFDLAPDAPDKEMPPAPEVRVLTQAERAVDALVHETRRGSRNLVRLAERGLGAWLSLRADPTGAIDQTAELVGSVGRLARPTTNPLSPIMTGRSLSSHFFTYRFSLARAKAASKAAGGKMNDAFVAGTARAFRLYHDRHGVACESLRMGMPISVRDDTLGDTAGNAFIPARIEVPLDIDDPAEHMAKVRELVLSARSEPANELVEVLANVLNRLPTTFTTNFFGSVQRGNDFTTSNVPGAPIPVYIDGQPLVAQWGFGPLAGVAANVTLISYQDDCNVAVNTDPASIPDPDLFEQCLAEAFEEILALGDAPERPRRGTRRSS